MELKPETKINFYKIPVGIFNNIYILNILCFLILFFAAIIFFDNFEIKKKKLKKLQKQQHEEQDQQQKSINLKKHLELEKQVEELGNENKINNNNQNINNNKQLNFQIPDDVSNLDEPIFVPEPSTPKSLNQSHFNIKIKKIGLNEELQKEEEHQLLPIYEHSIGPSSCCSSQLQNLNNIHSFYSSPSQPSSSSSTPNEYSPNINSFQPIIDINNNNNNNNFNNNNIITSNLLPISESTTIQLNKIIKINKKDFNNEYGFISGNKCIFTNFNSPLLKELNNNHWERIIPEDIQEVLFDFKFNTIIQPFSFPKSVKTIIFGQYFNQTIERDQLPPNLLKLYFGNSFTNGGCNFAKYSMPSKIEELGFGHSFHRELDENTVPLSVRKLQLGCYIQYAKRDEFFGYCGRGGYEPILKKVGKIPTHIEYLSMGNCFNEKLENIPKSVNLIFVKSNYKYFDDDKRFLEKRANQNCII
ncbi:hypothetical protein DDB_G0270524 [Dictyostelium discoideum AX4]|uniref:FNIP repeat-containing protein n=1 Tax=Dictyostelium discoideum TaxID=44689 RepID=Q55E11_DICDI|nr:hypothetical protein DDB_G0270524 [Dictyostelium discoideum AX4]EAL72612.1 hypothetical protein DDB_G0270524 [Dictyostelium discoideum AX4]|eukprot:XP_645970.1 hypothetical protein DDB_G0270524 [Dictyostelium discoideum AX4]